MELQKCQEMKRLFPSQAFRETPRWGEFFYYAKDRETLMDLYDYLLDEGFSSLEQPHENGSSIFVAKLMDSKGRIVLLRSN
jgi:hypothetical protein